MTYAQVEFHFRFKIVSLNLNLLSAEHLEAAEKTSFCVMRILREDADIAAMLCGAASALFHCAGLSPVRSGQRAPRGRGGAGTAKQVAHASGARGLRRRKGDDDAAALGLRAGGAGENAEGLRLSQARGRATEDVLEKL